MSLAFVFPGQGAQVVGMGRDLADAFPAARAVFDEVDEALGEKLSALIWEGEQDALTLTANAQPALMATSLAAMRALEAEGVTPSAAAFVAGHSLGEYSALAAAGALGVADCARLLRIRGRAMQEAVPVGMGAMAALLGLDFDTARAVAEEAAQGEVCQAANDNDPGQVVVSGHKAAVERAVEIARAKGAKRAVLLPVSAPFHCALMQPAAHAMQAALSEVTITAPAVPLVANVRAQAVSDPADIRALLVEQVTGAVRWRESVQFMSSAGVTEIWEIGAGKALSGMVRRINRAIACRAIATALITGASGGIGAAIARALHGAGATVALSGTRTGPLEALAGELGSRAHVLPCDLGDAAAVEALPGQAIAAMGSLDILVNNAGITRDQIFMRMSDDEWDEVLRVNLTSAMRLCRAAVRPMMKARWGRIVNIGSVVGAIGNPGQANYAAAKAGLAGMTKSIAHEVAGRGITANVVAPGFIATPMTDKLTDAQKAALGARIPAGRMGTPEEVAAAALYLSGPDAGYVTGTVLHVNGGLAMV
jgi:[acyl-carrier-protein] S-malonyltransferase